VAGSLDELVDPGAGGSALDELPQLFHDDAGLAVERTRRLAAVGEGADALLVAALDSAGDELEDGEEERGGDVVGDVAGVEDDERGVLGGDRGRAVEEVGVGAVAADLAEAVGEVRARAAA
jgi:hypothetical protein